MMPGSPTVELHGDLATFLVIDDGVGAVVRLPDHDVSVQLCTCSCSVRQRRTACNERSVKGREEQRGVPFSTSLPGVGERL